MQLAARPRLSAALPGATTNSSNTAQLACRATNCTQQEPQQQPEPQQPLTPPPGRKYAQLWKAKRPARKPRLLDAPRDPRDPLFNSTKRERKAALQDQLQRTYGPAAGDRDVRLYLKKRQLNAARPSRRGGFPLDDSLDQPGIFLKLSPDFQRTILLERVAELASTLHSLPPEAAWQLYSTLPGLLTISTLEVAQRLTGLAHALQCSREAALQHCCAFRPLAFLDPDTVLSRVGLLAKVARLESCAGAVALMQQHPALWLMNSRALAARVEQLSLLLHCCPVTSIKLVGGCPALLSAPLHVVQQQLEALCRVMDAAAAQPERVVPLLLWQPALLLAEYQQQSQQPQEEVLFEQVAFEHPQDQHQHQQQPSAAAVAQQLFSLSSALHLPDSQVQELVLRAPDLLTLAAGGTSAVAAAEAALSTSWLMCPQAAVQQRQQYQQQLLQQLQPWQYSRIESKRRAKQQQGGSQSSSSAAAAGPASGWYDAVQAAKAAVAECQWWAGAPNPKQQQQHQVPALQQLLLQAPALLVLAAPAGAPDDAPAAGCGGLLEQRLQQLYEQLSHLVLLDDEAAGGGTPQQQQQQQHAIITPAAVKQLVVLEPCVLTQPPLWVASQLRQLAAALQVPVRSMVALFCRLPALLWLTQAQVFERIRVLCGVLRLPAAGVKQALVASAQTDEGLASSPLLLMMMHPEALKKRDRAAVVSALRGGGRPATRVSV